jgi:transposase
MLYVGVDAHKSASQLTVVDELGEVVDRRRVASTGAALAGALGGYSEEPMKAVLEAGYGWGPIYDWLGEIADEVVLAHPTKVRTIAEARIKNDRLDSEILAHLLRADLVPEAYAPSKEVRAFKRMLRQRMFFVQLQTRVKNRIRALLAQHSLELPDGTNLRTNKALNWLKREAELPEPDASILLGDVALLEALKEREKGTEAVIEELAAEDPAVRVLRTLPGIGVFLSVLIRYEVGDIERFPSAKKFAAYTGLVPSTYASGDRLKYGKMTKQGNKWLRWAYVEAVRPAMVVSPYVRRNYERIKARKGATDARVATARKLAELTWKIWKEGRCYEER